MSLRSRGSHFWGGLSHFCVLIIRLVNQANEEGKQNYVDYSKAFLRTILWAPVKDYITINGKLIR